MLEKIKRIFNRKHKEDTIINNEPYKKDGIWYNVYDYITDKDISESEKKELKEEMNIVFSMTPTEYLRYKNFKCNHSHNENDYYSHGPKYMVGFEYVGIGKCVYCKCNVCGKTYDITDSDSW